MRKSRSFEVEKSEGEDGKAQGMDPRILTMSTCWMLGIVLFHSGAGVASPWYRELLADFRVGGVSFFFIVSGFFLVRHFQEGHVGAWWRRAVLKRVRTLLVPYVLWCAFGLTGFDLMRQFGIVGLGPLANSPLWYVKFLFLFCLVSPVLIAGLHRLGAWGLPFLVGLAILLPWFSLPMKFGLVHSLLMFSMGLSLGLDGGGRFVEFVTRRASAALLLWLLFYCFRALGLGGGAWGWPANVYSSCALVLGLWLLVRRIEFRGELPWFFRVSFWVYCLHGLALRWLPLHDASTVPWALANGLIVFGICSLAAFPAAKCCPRLYRVLTGDRGSRKELRFAERSRRKAA